jgi:hypothetical protein
LAGNSALVVLEDADLEQAVTAGSFGSFHNAGQVCMAASRHLVAAPIIEEYTALLAERADKLRVGDPASRTDRLLTRFQRHRRGGTARRPNRLRSVTRHPDDRHSERSGIGAHQRSDIDRRGDRTIWRGGSLRERVPHRRPGGELGGVHGNAMDNGQSGARELSLLIRLLNPLSRKEPA